LRRLRVRKEYPPQAFERLVARSSIFELVGHGSSLT
jgi:hypothetical protein